MRVRKNDVHIPLSLARALELLALYSEADKEIVSAAIILHDIGWYNIDSNEIFSKAFAGPDFLTSDIRYLHEKEGVNLARALLSKLNYEVAFIEKVCAIIDGHDTRKKASSLEDEIVRDADKLWRFSLTGISVACDWFGLSPTEYAKRLELDVLPQLHLPESVDIARRDLGEAKSWLLSDLI